MSRSPLFATLRRLIAQVPSRVTHDPDRRRLLQTSLAAATVAGVGSLPGCEPRGGDRVVIVGAGIAGLHCAHRLRRSGVEADVYEALDRVGGRMFSGRDLFLDGQVCELGGELIDSNHVTMWELADELGLTLNDRFAGEPAGFRREIYWIEGAEVSEATLLEQLEATRDAFADAYDAAETDDDEFDALNHTTLQAWLDEHVPLATYRELHLALAVAYRGEYGLETQEQSALNLIYLFGFDDDEHFAIFGESDERWHTAGGNDRYTTELAERLDPARLHLEHKLVRASLKSREYELEFETPAGAVTVTCDHLVLAVPFTILRGIDLRGLRLSRLKRRAIEQIGYGTNAKIMGGFSTRVWNLGHNAGGAITTDLAFQQTWDTSVGQTGGSGILTNFLGGTAGAVANAGTAADRWEAILDDVDSVLPGVKAAFTGAAVRMHWPTVPTALGSYTCYRPGDWDFWSTEGIRERNVHFCGEHCSADFQGWMEGAAETGALVAAEILDDIGISPDDVTARLVARKTLVPQPCYHGRPLTLRELRGRRHLLARRSS